MTDMEQLAARLVKAAKREIATRDVRDRTEGALIAVLREMADNPPEIKCWLPHQLRGLADYIEKGAGEWDVR